MLTCTKPIVPETRRDTEVNFLDARQADSFKFVLPCRTILSGPSNSGKSQTILSIMKNFNKFFTEEFDYVIFFHTEQDGLAESRKNYIEELKKHLPDLIVVEGLPATNKIAKLDGKKCLILEDMFQQLADSHDFVNLCTAGSHHADISFFMTTQNFYWPSKNRVTILRQATDLIIFPGILDKSILHTLSRQLFEDRNFLVGCFEWLKKRYKEQYKRAIWIDLNCLNYEMEDNMRVRANFIERNPMILFQNNNISN